MRKKTYSKKRAESSALTAQCFTASSSPFRLEQPLLAATPVKITVGKSSELNASKTTSSPDSPAKNTRSQQKKRAKKDYADHRPDESCLSHGSIGGLVEEMNALALTPNLVNGSTNESRSTADTECDISTNILQTRDANAGPSKPPSGRRKAKQKPASASNIEGIRPEFENLHISLDTSSRRKLKQDPVEPHTDTLASTDPNALGTTATKRSLRTKSRNSGLPDFASYAKPLLSICSDPAGRQGPTSFQAWADDLSKFFNITKIAEASYGEVYRLSLNSPHQGFSKSDESVLKLIALKPPPEPLRNSVTKTASSGKARAKRTKKTLAMSSVADVSSEVRLLQHMSPVPGFTNFREIRVLQGRLPRQFVAAWKQYNTSVKKSLFADPSSKASYGQDQLWAVVEMQDAGTDVETLIENGGAEQRVSVWAAWDVFWSVVCAVAKGDEWTGFEHRDLHMGNICVRSEGSSSGCILDPDVASLDLAQKVGFTGLETTLIDYTLSRADMSSGDGDVAFFDLSKDPAIFQGDGEEDYQYDIYRAMRSAVLYGDPAAEPRAEDCETLAEWVWRERHPIINLVWLHFVLFKLMERLPAKPNGGDAAHGALERELRRRLEAVSVALELKALAKRDLKSAADLIGWALEQDWLAEEDVVGMGESCDQ